MLAAALAKLTDGFLYSGDGAWDYDIFPARSEEFMVCYLTPGAARDPELVRFMEAYQDRLLLQVHDPVTYFAP
jgi:hypothetical protein